MGELLASTISSELNKSWMKKIISLGFKVLNIIEILVAFIRVCVPLLFHLNLFQSVLNAAIYSFVLNKKKLSRIYISLAAFRKNSFTACLLYFYVFHHKKKNMEDAFYFTEKVFLNSQDIHQEISALSNSPPLPLVSHFWIYWRSSEKVLQQRYTQKLTKSSCIWKII